MLFIAFEFLTKICIDASEDVFVVKVIIFAKTITYTYGILLVTALIIYSMTRSTALSLYTGLVLGPIFGMYYYKKHR